MTTSLRPIDELKRLTVEALTYDGPRGILAGIIGEIVEILEKAAEFQIDPDLDIADGETYSGEGLAISPTQAAMCAGEFQRTAMFIRGLHDAITEAIEKKKSPGPVRVLYAGSGPYATLALPLMTIFPPESVRFTILDIHPVSIESVKSIVRRFHLTESVATYALADASQYTIPGDEIPDIILSETMNAALEIEPQVAIVRHLMGQAPDALMVPESVKVDAALLDTSKELTFVPHDHEDAPAKSAPDRIPLGPVFELNTATIRSWADLDGDRLPATAVQMPPSVESRYRPFFMTTIVTYGDHLLRTHDSSLTGPRAIPEIVHGSPGLSFEFHYRLGNSPRLVCEA